MQKELSVRTLVFNVAGLMAVFVGVHLLCLQFYPKPELDPMSLSDFYPMSVFHFRQPAWWSVFPAAASVLVFWAWQGRAAAEPRWTRQWLVIFSLLLLTTLTLGFQFGLDYPTAGWGEGASEYWQDAMIIQGPLWFLRHFHEVQPYLLVHAMTHPPGPVLLYWCLGALLVQPWLVSVAVAAIALGLSLWTWDRLLRRVFGEARPEMLFLLGLLPGVQVYYLAVMDAIFAGVMLAAVLAFLEEDAGSAWRSAFWIWLATALSFGALFLGPVLGGMLLWRRRGWGRAAYILLLFVAAWALVYRLSGYNQWLGFRTASALENPGGFLATANPRGYFWYRIGSVLEISFYFTPFLCVLVPRGLQWLGQRSKEAWVLYWLGVGTVAAILLSGAMKIGEAARLCLFLIPFLLLPVAAVWPHLSRPRQRSLLALVFAQSLLMQLFGFYLW